jgi:hypothetical protein
MKTKTRIFPIVFLLAAAMILPAAALGQAGGSVSASGSASASAPAPAYRGGEAVGYDSMPVGLGVFGILIPAHQGKLHVDYSNWDDEDQSIKLKPVTGGVGLFFEYKIRKLFPRPSILPYLAVGLEMFFAFPKVAEFGGVDCDTCERDVFFAFNARLRLPIVLKSFVAVYPLFSIGVSNITHREEYDEADNYTGVDLTLGGGVEFYPMRYLFPFLEVRYLFGAGWDKTETAVGDADARVYYHAMLVIIGIRFL